MKADHSIPYFAVNDPFEIVYRKSSTSTPVKPHTHNALEIYFTLSDLPDVLLDDTVSQVSKGSLIIIPPHFAHQLFNMKLTVYERYIISINSNWLNNICGPQKDIMSYARFDSHPAVIKLSPEEAALLSLKITDFIDNYSQPSVEAYALFWALLDHMDKLIIKGLSSDSPGKRNITKSQKTVNEIINYINANLTSSLTLDTISEYFHLNKDYLGRLFKDHTHATVGHYISVQKSALAQNLLSKGYSVSEVQEKLGFSSYAYFFKFFKKMTGISPSQFRKKN